MTSSAVLTADLARRFQEATEPNPLGSFNKIEVEAADILASRTGPWLCLDGLTELSDDAAEALAKSPADWLCLNALKKISDRAASALSHRRGGLQLNGIQELSNRAADRLSRGHGPLFLHGLSRLGIKAAESLVRRDGIDLRVDARQEADLPNEAFDVLRAACRAPTRFVDHRRMSWGWGRRSLWYGDRNWPPPMPRRKFVIQNDDPTVWTLSSAVYQALDGSAWASRVEQGWFFTLGVPEVSVFRVLLNEKLTRAERAITVAHGRWPLLRVPDGVLMIGEHPWASLIECSDGSIGVGTQFQDRIGIVRVPPGCYAVEIHQTVGGTFHFQLQSLGVTTSWDPAMTSQDDNRLPKCPTRLPLSLRNDLPTSLQPPTARQSFYESNVGTFVGYGPEFLQVGHKFEEAPAPLFVSEEIASDFECALPED